MLLKKHLKQGGKSIADLSSSDFDYGSIQPFKRTDLENKYTFFGANEEGPIINLEPNDINLGNQKNGSHNNKNSFYVQPKSSKNQESKKPSTN